jgi:hypothetical protein
MEQNTFGHYNVPMLAHINEQYLQAFRGFHYLPLLYLLPHEIAEKRGLADFPRNPHIAVTSEKWREVYNSRKFQVNLLDAWAWMMWQCLGIKGGIDNYSINNPINRMVCDLPMWAFLLTEIGIVPELLADYPQSEEIPYITMEQAAINGETFANLFWNHPMLKMREVWEIVKTHRAHNDYSGMPSHAKMDFHRHYYHTRAKTKVEPIISGYGDDGEEEVVYAPYTPNEFADVEFRMWFDEFLAGLNEKDRQIIGLLEQGYIQEEIGRMLGYSNHSGVAKRVKYIRKEFIKFREADAELLKRQHAQGKKKKSEQSEQARQ